MTIGLDEFLEDYEERFQLNYRRDISHVCLANGYYAD